MRDAGYFAGANQLAEQVAAPPRFQSLAAQLEELVKGAEESAVRVSRVADRLGGAVPQEVSKGTGGASSATCVASHLEALIAQLALVQSRTFESISRLERL